MTDDNDLFKPHYFKRIVPYTLVLHVLQFWW